MKKALLAAIICAVMAITAVYGQHTQSIQITGPATWTPGTQITLGINLTYAGYSSPGYSLWLEVANGVAPFLSIVSHTNSVFTDPNNVNPKPAPFNQTMGATAGFRAEPNDQGGTTKPNIVGGTYHVADITLMLDAGAASLNGQTFTIASTTVSPKISEVSDSDFNDNAIPRGTFMFTIGVPEPSTLALVGVGVVVSALVAYRRRKAAR